MAAVSEEEIDGLYSVPLSEFIDVRKALATRAKKEGDKEGAAHIAALPKPSAAAWAVNQLYRHASDELDALHEAGASLRRAHRKGASGVREVFAAQQAQRAAIDALLQVARTILQKGGLAASDLTLDRIGETLTFISTLNRWGDAEPGRLSKELAPPGFDALLEVLGDGEELPPPIKKKEPAAKAPPKAPADSSHQRKAVAEARRKAEEALAAAKKNKAHAEARAKETNRAADEAQKAANDAESNARHLADAVKAAEAALARTKREASEAAKEASAAADHAETARTTADRARRANDDAADELRKAEAHLASAKKAEAALNKGR
ncbi:hypothetical protein LZC95_01550 [Pendulispora brunnea]|uniref:TolA protein n=1 Tax=Pendulispora brunnea TaxID=2905690 RepID=A0ABZ2KGK7_9BACT